MSETCRPTSRASQSSGKLRSDSCSALALCAFCSSAPAAYLASALGRPPSCGMQTSTDVSQNRESLASDSRGTCSQEHPASQCAAVQP